MMWRSRQAPLTSLALPFSLLLLCLLLLRPVQAITVLVDVGNGTSQTTGIPGEYWNNYDAAYLSGATPLVLLDTMGNATGYSLSHDRIVQAVTENSNVPVGAPYPVSAAIDSYYSASATTFTLSGLTPTLTYDLTIYGFLLRPDSSRLTGVTINGVEQTYDPAADLAGDSTTFYGLTPDSNGVINFTLASKINGSNFIIGVIELTAVPEPSRALLLTLAGVMILSRRRR